MIIYQPQAESFKGDILAGRAAVSVRMNGKDAPVFGAAWFQARAAADRDSRTAKIIDVSVTKAVFRQASPEQEKQFSDFVTRPPCRQGSADFLDRLRANLETAEREAADVSDLRNDPPKILFATTPTVLVILDGPPEMRPLEGSKVMRVVNTPFAIVFNPASKTYFLRAGDEWVSAADISGPWQPRRNLPEDVRKALPPEMLKGSSGKNMEQPEIVVSTEPAELIVTDGAPKYTPLPGNDLLYVSNTESDLFLEIESGRYFVLLAGRWFSRRNWMRPGPMFRRKSFPWPLP